MAKASSVLTVHPQRAPQGVAVVGTLLLANLSLGAWGVLLAVAPPALTPWPNPSGVAVLHLFTAGFLTPVALAAATQLMGALAAPAPRPASWAWLLPVGWLAGVAVAWGMTAPGAELAVAGGALAAVTLAVLLGNLSSALAARSGPPALRLFVLGTFLGLTGLLATLAVGVRLALGLEGALPGPLPLPVHLALAAGASFVPLLLAVSGQLFPMFARAPAWPPGPPRLGPLAGSWGGAVLLVLGAWGEAQPLLVAGGALTFGSLAAWTGLQEVQYARRRGSTPDPAAWGARLAAFALTAGAGLATAGLLRGGAGGGLLAPGVVLVLAGGVGGSMLAYLRRILPFATWNLLYRRFGGAPFLPRLDDLRWPWPVPLLPVAWLAGAALAAWGAGEPQAGLGGLLQDQALRLLGAVALAGAAENLWTGLTALVLAWRHRSVPPPPG